MVTPVQQRSNACKCSPICSKAVSYLPAGGDWPTERSASLQSSLLQILSFSLNHFSSDWEKRNISTTEHLRQNSSLKKRKKKYQQNKTPTKVTYLTHSNICCCCACKWQRVLVSLHLSRAAGGSIPHDSLSCTRAGTGTAKPLLLWTVQPQQT